MEPEGNVESLSLLLVFRLGGLGHRMSDQGEIRRAGVWVSPLGYLPYGPLWPTFGAGPETPFVSQLLISDQLVLNEIELIRG